MTGQLLVDSTLGMPRPWFLNDVGQDGLESITVVSGSDVIVGGTVMGKITSSGKYAPYDNGDSPAGVGTAVGILYYRVDPTEGDVLGSLMVRGDVLSGLLVGFDSNAATDLAGRFYFV